MVTNCVALKAKSATDRRGAAEPDRAVLGYALMPPALVNLMKGLVGILPARRRAGEFLAPVRGKPFPQPFFLGYREGETLVRL
jgi:hypothetical protein